MKKYFLILLLFAPIGATSTSFGAEESYTIVETVNHCKPQRSNPEQNKYIRVKMKRHYLEGTCLITDDITIDYSCVDGQKIGMGMGGTSNGHCDETNSLSMDDKLNSIRKKTDDAGSLNTDDLTNEEIRLKEHFSEAQTPLENIAQERIESENSQTDTGQNAKVIPIQIPPEFSYGTISVPLGRTPYQAYAVLFFGGSEGTIPPEGLIIQTTKGSKYLVDSRHMALPVVLIKKPESSRVPGLRAIHIIRTSALPWEIIKAVLDPFVGEGDRVQYTLTDVSSGKDVHSPVFSHSSHVIKRQANGDYLLE